MFTMLMSNLLVLLHSYNYVDMSKLEFASSQYYFNSFNEGSHKYLLKFIQFKVYSSTYIYNYSLVYKVLAKT